jgi:hypothetical protein
VNTLKVINDSTLDMPKFARFGPNPSRLGAIVTNPVDPDPGHHGMSPAPFGRLHDDDDDDDGGQQRQLDLVRVLPKLRSNSEYREQQQQL